MNDSRYYTCLLVDLIIATTTLTKQHTLSCNNYLATEANC